MRRIVAPKLCSRKNSGCVRASKQWPSTKPNCSRCGKRLRVCGRSGWLVTPPIRRHRPPTSTVGRNARAPSCLADSCFAPGVVANSIGSITDALARKRCLSIHLPGNGAGESRGTGGAAPRTGGEGEEVRHVPPVHTWPAWHGIRHPPQLAGSLEVSTHFPKQNICPTRHCRPCAFAADWVMQRNRPIVSPATKARPGGLRPLPKALLPSLSPAKRVLCLSFHLRVYNRPAIRALILYSGEFRPKKRDEYNDALRFASIAL